MIDNNWKISLRVDKKEIALLQEACIFGADADENIENAVKEKGGYRIDFSYEELDDLADCVAERANNEESSHKQERWDKLCDKIDSLLKFNEPTSALPSPQTYAPQSPALRYYIFDIWIKRGRGVNPDRKSTRLNSSHITRSRMPSSA